MVLVEGTRRRNGGFYGGLRYVIFFPMVMMYLFIYLLLFFGVLTMGATRGMHSFDMFFFCWICLNR